MGSGFPQESMLPPGTRGPPGVLASSPTSRLLPSFHPFFPGTGGQGPGLPLYFQEAGLPLYFQGARLPVVRGPCGHAFRRQGFQASMLSGGHASKRFSGGFPVAGFQTSRLPPCFQRTRLSGCFQDVFRGPVFPKASIGPCFQGARASRPDFAYIK